jgi:prepilin-type N-terminal cleavage/methylation domain-containing protein/prepilin-type processing-associated H-X9-DG protein
MLPGFTLLELLIVIVVIGILVSLTIPVIDSVKRKARSTQCKANLKQLQIAATSYAFDHGGHMPRNRNGTSHWRDHQRVDWYETGSIGWVDWTNFPSGVGHYQPRPTGESKWWGAEGRRSVTNGALWNYIGGSLKVYACPEFKRIVKRDPDGNVINETNLVVRSYVMNYKASYDNIKKTRASEVMLFADGSITNEFDGDTISDRNLLVADKWAYDGSLYGTNKNGNYPVESVGTYHNGSANAVFVDGHVEEITWEQTQDACWGHW